MPLTLDENASRYQIKACKPGSIKINNAIYTRSLILTPTQLLDDWQPQTYAELTPASFTQLIALNPHIVLIGTGSQHELLSIEYYSALINAHIGVEVMATSAACRTFNVLTSENRHVVAALLIQ